MSALDKQVGGDHYKKQAIQPIEYIHANDLGFCEGNVVKYVSRWRDKNGIADLEKAKHYIELLIQLEANKARKAMQDVKAEPPTQIGSIHFYKGEAPTLEEIERMKRG